MLTEHSTATIVIVDRNSRPGGHWTKAYPYVKLHQSSCYYGVNSVKLGKHRDKYGNEVYDVHDRATGAEVLDYYQTVLDKFVATGRVRCFFNAEHQNDAANTIVVRNRTVLSDETVFCVKCRKLVTVATNVTVPSMRKPLIPVHESVDFVPLNELSSRVDTGKYTNYVVFGNGKSGIDAVAHLVLAKRVDPSNITWILGRDAWYYLRDSFQDYYDSNWLFGKLTSAASVTETFLRYETDGLVCRLDLNVLPTVFKGAMVGTTEFETIRRVPNVVRKGRAVSVGAREILLERGTLWFDPSTTLLVDCMVDNQYGYTFDENFTIFQAGRITLGPEISIFNPSFSSAIIAFLECAIPDDDETRNSQNNGENSRKNDYCFFLRGKQHCLPHPESFVGQYYMDSKTFDALWKLEGGQKFLLRSRLFDASPMHHEGGIRKMMWAWFGPQPNLSTVSTALVEKVDSYGFSDVDHRFGIETLLADRRKRIRNRRKRRWKALFRSFSGKGTNERTNE
jgi:hypothetical protein